MTVAALIRNARLSANLTQAELARRVGTTQPAIARLERNGSNATVETLDRVLLATGHRLQMTAVPQRSGVDESLIRQQLELTPAQRLATLETLYEQARKFAEAGARARGELA